MVSLKITVLAIVLIAGIFMTQAAPERQQDDKDKGDSPSKVLGNLNIIKNFTTFVQDMTKDPKQAITKLGDLVKAKSIFGKSKPDEKAKQE
ncbi:unnamed protein product [Leptosia nina]|uniref:Uncharacterized protein n=1 Tax=Leptosia nina TaxID=320188 RepID=A0AAV1JW41_9NEOP